MRRARRHALQEPEETAVDMTPMMDVVFIMLVFFITTATFIKDSGLEVKRPQASSAIELKEPVTITLQADGRLTSDNSTIPVAALGVWLSSKHPLDSAIAVQADARAPSGQLVEVLDELRLTGFTNIALVADPL
ncbi:biopolymer transporter ExbD [Parendozoicomonas sp. Alg238-R29]|uniref:ExbD/TolR family protein n=1 Tax=Parendozoicomonas sp. Alg238-R29 TaxID=2993446 RepID=UPI00248E8EB3|nr:biopolymer transporter ExbD [Parendozoicomonas sp. Alg238-R29]